MSRVIAGDYGGVFGLERPRRVFRDCAGPWCLGSLLVVLFESSEDFFFSFSVRTLTYNKKKIWGAPLHSVISQTSNNKGFHTIHPSVMSERGLAVTPVRPRNQQTNGGWLELRGQDKGIPKSFSRNGQKVCVAKKLLFPPRCGKEIQNNILL